MSIKLYPTYLSTILGNSIFSQEDSMGNLCWCCMIFYLLESLEHFAEAIYYVLIFAVSVKMGYLFCFLVAVHRQFISYWRPV